MMDYIHYPLKCNGKVHDVFVEIVGVKWDNDGIGAYEYWGAWGYDKGHTYIAEVDIRDIMISNGNRLRKLPKKQTKALASLLGDDDDFYKAVETYMIGKKENKKL